jgi:hypothetical protein
MEVCDQFHAPATLPPGEWALGTHWTRAWVSRKVGLDAVGKRSRTPDYPDRCLVTVQPEVFKFVFYYPWNICVVTLVLTLEWQVIQCQQVQYQQSNIYFALHSFRPFGDIFRGSTVKGICFEIAADLNSIISLSRDRSIVSSKVSFSVFGERDCPGKVIMW